MALLAAPFAMAGCNGGELGGDGSATLDGPASLDGHVRVDPDLSATQGTLDAGVDLVGTAPLDLTALGAVSDLTLRSASDLKNAGTVDMARMASTDGGMLPCGVAGNSCCAGGTCNGGGCCVGDTCVNEGRGCGSGLSCVASACTSCGGSEEPCCDGSLCNDDGCCREDNTCAATQTSCGNGLTCRGTGICAGGTILCGGNGLDACCPGANGLFCTAPSNYCEQDRCVGCGDTGEHCCDGEACINGGCCTQVADRYVCVAPGDACGLGTCGGSSCGGCGALGEACCPGNVCTQTDSVCDFTTLKCVPCGGLGQPCCAPNNFCALGRACNSAVCM